MAKYQRLPAEPLFGAVAKTDKDSLETKKVWTDRLLYLLDTPLATTDLKKLPEFEELQEMYGIEGMTLSDLIHFQQILRAARGDTKAYSALTKVVGQGEDHRRQSDMIDPLKKMVDILHGALGVARGDGNVVVDAEFEDMFYDEPTQTIIEVQIVENTNDSDGDD